MINLVQILALLLQKFGNKTPMGNLALLLAILQILLHILLKALLQDVLIL